MLVLTEGNMRDLDSGGVLNVMPDRCKVKYLIKMYIGVVSRTKEHRCNMCSVQGHYSLSYFRPNVDRLKIYFQENILDNLNAACGTKPTRRQSSSSSFDLLTEDAVSTTS